MKQWAMRAFLVALTLGACWGAAEVAYRMLEERIKQQISRSEGVTSLSRISIKKLGDIIDSAGGHGEYHGIDPVLGWTIQENVDGGMYASNSIGTRGKRDYPPGKPDDIAYRVAAFGDSFTHGDDVANEHTWEHFMEQKNPELEVMNFGVGGYGTDQAWLRYQRKGKRYKPDIVLIGFMVENIQRNVNAFVPFYRRLSSPFTKPRFSLNDDNELVLHENLLKSRADYIRLRDNQREMLQKLGRHDYYYQRLFLNETLAFKPVKLAYYIYINITDPWVVDHNRQYNPRSEPYRVTLRIMEEFYREAEAAGSTPWILIFPELTDVMRTIQGKAKRHQPLLDALKERDMRFIDVLDGFERKNMLRIGKLYDGHYTEFGNELVSEIVLEELGLEK